MSGRRESRRGLCGTVWRLVGRRQCCRAVTERGWRGWEREGRGERVRGCWREERRGEERREKGKERQALRGGFEERGTKSEGRQESDVSKTERDREIER